jgi:intein/homing endonuclease
MVIPRENLKFIKNLKMDKKIIKNLSKEDLAYLAGFLEGDGCILAQIVKGKAYKYKYTVRLSVVFYQRKDKH